MKKQKNYAGLAVLIVFIMAALPSVGPSLWKVFDKPANGIIKSNTDERGLTSVKYVQDGKTWALDYLDGKEVDSLKGLFNRGCVGPCQYGYCKATFGGGLACNCCADTQGGYCFIHKKKVVDTIGH